MIIEAKGIEKSFGALKVLKGVDFQVDCGEVVAIMGASGAGKSTLLQILGTLSTPDAGTLTVDGTDVLHLGSRELPGPSTAQRRHVSRRCRIARLSPGGSDARPSRGPH